MLTADNEGTIFTISNENRGFNGCEEDSTIFTIIDGNRGGGVENENIAIFTTIDNELIEFDAFAGDGLEFGKVGLFLIFTTLREV